MIKVYSTDNCPRCLELKAILEKKGIEFDYALNDPEARTIAIVNGLRAFPFIDNEKGSVLSMEDFLKTIE